MTTKRLRLLKTKLLATYLGDGFWEESNPVWPLPDPLKRGSEAHLLYLTLVYTLAGGSRAPTTVWQNARLTFKADPQLFEAHFLAYAKAVDLVPRLKAHNLTQKSKSEATTWQRIGQAIVMRADGSVKKLLVDHNYNAQQLLSMLAKSKITFPVLSGPQLGPRWLTSLSREGEQSLSGIEYMTVPTSPTVDLALQALSVKSSRVSAQVFEPLDMLGRYGCRQREATQKICPVAQSCPVANFCQYGNNNL